MHLLTCCLLLCITILKFCSCEAAGHGRLFQEGGHHQVQPAHHRKAQGRSQAAAAAAGLGPKLLRDDPRCAYGCGSVDLSHWWWQQQQWRRQRPLGLGMNILLEVLRVLTAVVAST